MKIKSMLQILLIAVALSPMVYLAIIWNTIPEVVPMHFNAEMKPDDYGHKSGLWLVSGLIAGVSILMLFLFRFINSIDPKRRNQPPSPTFSKLAAGLVVFMAILNFLILFSAKGSAFRFEHLLFPLLGLLFAFIGNYMHNIKPNYFAGIRLPWTLSDDDNWKRTHQLGGKVWFWGGIIFAIASLFIPSSIAVFVLVALVLVMVLIPSVYSYRIFKERH